MPAVWVPLAVFLLTRTTTNQCFECNVRRGEASNLHAVLDLTVEPWLAPEVLLEQANQRILAIFRNTLGG